MLSHNACNYSDFVDNNMCSYLSMREFNINYDHHEKCKKMKNNLIELKHNVSCIDHTI